VTHASIQQLSDLGQDFISGEGGDGFIEIESSHRCGPHSTPPHSGEALEGYNVKHNHGV